RQFINRRHAEKASDPGGQVPRHVHHPYSVGNYRCLARHYSPPTLGYVEGFRGGSFIYTRFINPAVSRAFVITALIPILFRENGGLDLTSSASASSNISTCKICGFANSGIL